MYRGCPPTPMATNWVRATPPDGLSATQSFTTRVLAQPANALELTRRASVSDGSGGHARAVKLVNTLQRKGSARKQFTILRSYVPKAGGCPPVRTAGGVALSNVNRAGNAVESDNMLTAKNNRPQMVLRPREARLEDAHKPIFPVRSTGSLPLCSTVPNKESPGSNARHGLTERLRPPVTVRSSRGVHPPSGGGATSRTDGLPVIAGTSNLVRVQAITA